MEGNQNKTQRSQKTQKSQRSQRSQKEAAQQVPLTHWKQWTNPDYIGAYSLQPGEERMVEIVKVERRKVKGEKGAEKECTVAILKDEKPFILNKTNCKTLERIYGTPYIEHWSSRRIIIHAENVEAFGQHVDALRIKDEMPALPAMTPDSPKWKSAAEALSEGKTTIDAIKKRFRLSEDHEAQLITLSKK